MKKQDGGGGGGVTAPSEHSKFCDSVQQTLINIRSCTNRIMYMIYVFSTGEYYVLHFIYERKGALLQISEKNLIT
jgi:hypothetical protein